MSKPILETLLTPTGVLSLVWLNEPSQYGKFQATITLSTEEAAPMIRTLEDMRDRVVALRELTGEPEVDFALPYTVNEENDEVSFKFRMNYEKKNHKTGTMVKERPIVVDALKKPIDTAAVSIRAGSKGRLKGVAYSTVVDGKGYVSIKLKAAQIIELSQGDFNATDGFDAVDGYDFAASETTDGDFEAQ